jgi:hypothetical protein
MWKEMDSMKPRQSKKRKVAAFGVLKRSLSDALDYEQGRKTTLRVSQLPPAPPKGR